MSIETMSFVLGAILLVAGLFGGGLEIRELKLPMIGTRARIMTAAVGAVFILLALAISQQWISRTEVEPAAPASGAPRTFEPPMIDGMRLDVCIEWGKRCDGEAATAWCKAQGYDTATGFASENVGGLGIPTKLLGSREICREEICAAFTRITCSR